MCETISHFANSLCPKLRGERVGSKSKMNIRVAFEIGDVFFYVALLALSVMSFCLLSAGILFSCLILSRGMRPSRAPRMIFATVCCIAITAGAVMGLAILVAALRNVAPQKWLLDIVLAAVLTYHGRPNRIGEVLLIPLNAAFVCSTAILAVEGM